MLKKALLQFGYKPASERKQHSPSPYMAPNYGQKVQMTDLDLSPAFTEADKTKLQQSNGKFLYYGRAVDDTMLHALNHLATKVNSGTENTMKSLTHFLDYCYHHQDAKKLYKASNMILHIDSNAAYLVESGARSRAGRFFYVGNKNGKLIN